MRSKVHSRCRLLLAALCASWCALGSAQPAAQVVDLPSRAGVMQRLLYLAVREPKAAVILYAGGHGGLGIDDSGSLRWGAGNFVVRSRQLFAQQQFAVAVIDAPSDRQSPPFLGGARQQPEHVADAKAAIAWLRRETGAPVWLVGTSRGTQSVAYIATQAGPAEGGPDGIVLTSSILADPRSRSVPAMPLDRIGIPVLVVHHEQDGCRVCPYSEIGALMSKLNDAPRKQLLSFTGGTSEGDPCEAHAYHGFNGLERDVVAQIAAWIKAR